MGHRDFRSGNKDIQMAVKILNRIHISVFIIILFLLHSCGGRKCDPCPPCPPCPVCDEVNFERTGQPKQEPATWFVWKVTDGDTIGVRLEGPVERRESVRLLRIDTPERGERGFDKAREALKTLLKSGRARLEFENPEREDRGGYGRLLAYVIVDGLNVNIEMVRLGWSKFYTKYGRGRYAGEFEKAQKEAEKAGRGLWK